MAAAWLRGVSEAPTAEVVVRVDGPCQRLTVDTESGPQTFRAESLPKGDSFRPQEGGVSILVRTTGGDEGVFFLAKDEGGNALPSDCRVLTTSGDQAVVWLHVDVPNPRELAAVTAVLPRSDFGKLLARDVMDDETPPANGVIAFAAVANSSAAKFTGKAVLQLVRDDGEGPPPFASLADFAEGRKPRTEPEGRRTAARLDVTGVTGLFPAFFRVRVETTPGQDFIGCRIVGRGPLDSSEEIRLNVPLEEIACVTAEVAPCRLVRLAGLRPSR